MVYVHNKFSYFVSVVLTGIFTVLIVAWSFFMVSQNVLPQLFLFIAFIAGYNVWNTFVSQVNIKEIKLDGNRLEIKTLSKTHEVKVDECESFKIREFPSAGKMYIRIKGTKSRRFWIDTKYFNDSKTLFRELLNIEFEKHPNSLKARARKVNTEYNKITKKKV
ncbi:hypothetical protein [Streptococcus massiliensis]|uniref:Uncharacterized protein n=1 Tax=Streptococcus massiliensis TaxID=313439 RepID=A0A380L4M5_9STRE|nr:hypothetical protein [Streptococcus massiliensis]SUN77431.1 Uncharacterised protein [Streptococcus massiliensis]